MAKLGRPPKKQVYKYDIVYETPLPPKKKKYKRYDFAAACSDTGIVIVVKPSGKSPIYIELTHPQMMKFKGVISQAWFDYFRRDKRKGKLIKEVK